MKYKISLLINVLFVLAIATYLANHYFFQSLNWELISAAKSPNGHFLVHHYRSNSEDGHAPYGDNFVISSWRSFPQPHNPETFYASYCGANSNFQWASNNEIIINCSNAEEPTYTQASIVHGIKITVQN